MHAPLIVSLVVGLAVGFFAQRSRFCTMGAFRDLILFRQAHLFWGLLALAVVAFFTNLIVGELAFLADEEAPHPFYTRGFILHEDMRAPALIERAYQHENTAACLFVKGQPDYVADRQGVHTTIDLPVEEAMEAIGGTGDTVTGIVAALIEAGIDVKESSIIGARVNRLAGHYAGPAQLPR